MARRADPSLPPPQFCLTVREFCQSHRVSKTLFYALLRAGRGPRVTKLGRRSLVTIEDAESWRRRVSENG